MLLHIGSGRGRRGLAQRSLRYHLVFAVSVKGYFRNDVLGSRGFGLSDSDFLFYVLLSTTMVQRVARAAIVPNAASHGARRTPMRPIVTGISMRFRPDSSFMIILLTFPSCMSSLTFVTRSSEETENVSCVVGCKLVPHVLQNFHSSLVSAPHWGQ